ncbi:hypothetical protein NQ317_002651 [Molorchus minor]|uniref:Axonemal 84 kDa protein n=1 Tax=Molorchus minor TaxID=1323400 RepID=A0ABQ9JKC7_9CUCU|nr:hypothetical protein NQ317_002651 [Molorchus minor]
MAKKKKKGQAVEGGKELKGQSSSKLATSKSKVFSKQSLRRSKSRMSYDSSSSDSSKDEQETKVPEGKKGKKKEEPVEEVVPGPGPGAEGVGEATWAEILRMREEAAAILAEMLEEEEGEEEAKPKKKKGKKAPKKKGKKVKMTTAMLEQMKKEAEEEAAREAEMERRRLEEEKKAAIEKERRETIEQQVRCEQLEKSQGLMKQIAKFNKKIYVMEKYEQDWKIYISCRELPNASIVNQMSTHLHLWDLAMEKTSIEDASKRTENVIQLTEDLQDLLDIFVDEDPQRVENWKWMRQLFRDYQKQNLDVATYRVLRDVEKNLNRIDIPTADFDFQNDYFKLSIWLRVQLPIPLPNPRRPPKPRIEIAFQKVDLSVFFPLVLDCENMAIRVMYLKYDHLSDLSDTFYIPSVPPEMLADLNTSMKEEWRFKLKYKYKFREKVPQGQQVDENGAIIPPQPEKEEFESDEEIPAVPYRLMDPTSSEYAIATDSTCSHLFYGDARQVFAIDLPSHVVNLRKFTILGGVYHLNLIFQPPQPQTFITMDLSITRLYLPKRLEYVPYYIGYEPPVPPEPDVIRTPEEIEAEMKQLEEDMEKLMFITMTWPQHVLFIEPPIVCHWDEEEKLWSRKDVHDLKHIEEKGILSFRTGAFGIFGLATPRYANLPYQAWEIRPEEDGTITFQLTAAVLFLEFNIKEGLICITLLKNSPNKSLKSLVGTYFKFYKLKRIMKEAGVDIFPDHDAYCYVENSCEKHWPMERHLYRNMAMLCNTFNFTWSRWNLPAGRRKIVMQMREYAPSKPKQKNYSMLLVTPLNATYVNCTEVSQFFIEEEIEGIRFCADLCGLIKVTCSITLRKKIENVSWELVHALANLLESTRVLSFS